ncbi:MAG: hypothetical protein ABIO05_09085 [Ferruginibacter sp.]
MKFAIVIFILLCFAGCSNNKEYDINTEELYTKGRASIEMIEKKNPRQFLRVAGSSKKNLLKQTVVKGNIYNNARVVTYKDVAIKLKFLSKTGALLEEDTQVIYESIHPGGSQTFKSKFFAPKGTDSVSMAVIGAKL